MLSARIYKNQCLLKRIGIIHILVDNKIGINKDNLVVDFRIVLALAWMDNITPRINIWTTKLNRQYYGLIGVYNIKYNMQISKL